MAVGDAYVFPGFLTPVLAQLFFPEPPTASLTCFCRGERRKYTGKKVRLNRGSNSQPPSHESDTLTNEPPGRGWCNHANVVCNHDVGESSPRVRKGDIRNKSTDYVTESDWLIDYPNDWRSHCFEYDLSHMTWAAHIFMYIYFLVFSRHQC